MDTADRFAGNEKSMNTSEVIDILIAYVRRCD